MAATTTTTMMTTATMDVDTATVEDMAVTAEDAMMMIIEGRPKNSLEVGHGAALVGIPCRVDQ